MADSTASRAAPLPFAEAPGFGEMREVAEGILWLRLPLPYQLDHVNIYLLREDAGWAVVDVGINDERSRAIWETVLDGPLRGTPLSRLIITHHHPDHMGLAGWLAERFDIPVHMTFTEFLMGKYYGTSRQAISGSFQYAHYARHGAPPEQAQLVVERGHSYLERISGLPDTILSLEPGGHLDIGGRRWEVQTGGGHSPGQAMLYCRADNIFLAADQVIERISPNVSVMAMEPVANPLGAFLTSLEALRGWVAPDALTLSGHRLPLIDPHRRIAELISHHHDRCDLLERSLSAGSQAVYALTPVLFPRVSDPHQVSFAFSETLAHVNYMIATGRLRADEEGGILRIRRN